MTVTDFIKTAVGEIGYLEKASNADLDSKTGNAGNNNWTKYARDLADAGFFNGNKNGYAWCAVFVTWCAWVACGRNKAKAMEALCQSGLYGAGCTQAAGYYRAKGRFDKTPKAGDQIFFGYSGDEYHTGIVEKVEGGRVHTIEGNTSGNAGVVDNGGGVFRKSYAIGSTAIAGYGHPVFDGQSRETTTNTEKTTEAKTVNVTLDILQKGSAGAQVKTLQRLLIADGYSVGSWGADGDFGDGTLAGLKKYQKAKGLTADGICGAKTWEKILRG